MSVPNEQPITMTFTAHEWRLLACAAVKVKQTAFIDGLKCKQELRTIATSILKETGK